MGFGHLLCAAAFFDGRLGDPEHNAAMIAKEAEDLSRKGVFLAVFPELCLTGATCGDLFFSAEFIKRAEKALGGLLESTKQCEMLMLIGLPVMNDNFLYNCAAAIQGGRLLAVVPGLPRAGQRWFSHAHGIGTVRLCGQEAPFGGDILIGCENFDELRIGVGVGYDLTAPLSVSAELSALGATVIASLAAVPSYDCVSVLADLRAGAERHGCAHILSGADGFESSSEDYYTGLKAIAQGRELFLSKEGETAVLTVDAEMSARELRLRQRADARAELVYAAPPSADAAPPKYPIAPYIPMGCESGEYFRRVLDMQSGALARRMKAISCGHLVLGLSGGLDSSLALFVCLDAAKKLGMGPECVHAMSLPCFGTSEGSRSCARTLAAGLGCDFTETDIRENVRESLMAIGHAGEQDTTFENAQARYRTQLLMDFANKAGGIVVGTGDLSELAIGFTTYSGDHMSMYNVNASLPKSVVRGVIRTIALDSDGAVAQALVSVLEAAVSPELLPSVDGEPGHATESIVGRYEIIDFALYFHLRYAFSQEKTGELALSAFEGIYSEEDVLKAVGEYYSRFYRSQFKRSCMPEGACVTGLSISPRGALVLPGDLPL